jgi:hypothetical protein
MSKIQHGNMFWDERVLFDTIVELGIIIPETPKRVGF